tara:strand:+ start:14631 stop:14756 length:126 start_codon:yes stop_codon:yes gene_type:complete
MINRASCQSFGFHFKIDLGVDVRRIDADVAQPGTDCVDVYA